MWYNTQISELFGIKYPILLGPLGGGFSTVELLAVVSNAGGLGSFGAYTLSPQEIREVGDKIKTQTKKPFNINLWVSNVDERLAQFTKEDFEQVASLFKPYYDELSIPVPKFQEANAYKFEKQVEAILSIRPAVFSFIFGIPDPEILSECRRLNIKTVGSATTLDEGLFLEAAGVDAIIAAGFEGGGHRPSFLRPAQDSLTGTLALVRQLTVKLNKTSVIATGGIADGAGIAAALRLGATGVQIGTAFLACQESNATAAHRELLHSDAARHTVLSKSLTGRMGRMIENRISKEITSETNVLPFPLQTRFLAPLKEEALKQGRHDLVNFWCGQGAPLIRHHSAQLLMETLIKETK